jgi:DnaJ-class molecular chaperone
MKKTNAQLEKRKREKEKRKKTEKAILRLAADIPNSPSPAVAASTKTEGVSIASRSSIHDDRAVKCLRCDGTGHLTSKCNMCNGSGVMPVRCKKCSGTGTYTQESGPCVRCREAGVLLDGSVCPRCKGRKVQMAFTTPCSQCSGTGSFNSPCKKCGGSLQVVIDCSNCNGTGLFLRKTT